MKTISVDWDGTLVDAQTQEWLPGAQGALHVLLRRFDTIIIWTAHANWPQGREHVETRLRGAFPRRGSRLRIEPKPLADLYVDDNAVRFEGDWSATLADVRRYMVAKRKAHA